MGNFLTTLSSISFSWDALPHGICLLRDKLDNQHYTSYCKQRMSPVKQTQPFDQYKDTSMLVKGWDGSVQR